MNEPSNVIDHDRVKLHDPQIISIIDISMAMRMIAARNELISNYRSHTNRIDDDIYIDMLKSFNNDIKNILGI